MADKFPMVIHVTREGESKDDEYLEVHKSGVFDIDEAGKEVAIYQRVKVGHVQIDKQFIEKGRKKR